MDNIWEDARPTGTSDSGVGTPLTRVLIVAQRRWPPVWQVRGSRTGPPEGVSKLRFFKITARSNTDTDIVKLIKYTNLPNITVWVNVSAGAPKVRLPTDPQSASLRRMAVVTSAELTRLNGKISQARRDGRNCSDLERELAAARIQ
jgi:hypothetical protein